MDNVIRQNVESRLTVLGESDCSYLPGRNARLRAVMASSVDAGVYQELLDGGFRRSGRMIYRPDCVGCRACISLRVPVAAFQPSRSQRRCGARNADLRVDVRPPVLSDEKVALYTRYTREWHDHADDRVDAVRESLRSFLYESPTQTVEFTYRDSADRLLAVSICDIGPSSLSSVYCYFDPAEAARGLGTFAALAEIAWARERAINHYYLGYWIVDCAAMNYKANFRPHELLGSDGRWCAAAD